jgi:hypothetical protein
MADTHRARCVSGTFHETVSLRRCLLFDEAELEAYIHRRQAIETEALKSEGEAGSVSWICLEMLSSCTDHKTVTPFDCPESQ